MRRSALLILLAVLAVAVAAPASIAGAAAPADATAQTAAKAKKKAGKKKAAKCKAAKKKGKAKGKARKSLAAADSAARKGKAKGKKKAKRKCGKAKPKAAPRKRSRNPIAERIADKMRERREQMEERRRNAPKPLTLQDVAPADGTYTSTSAPGLTVTVSGNSTQARVQYTVPTSAFDALCQPHTTGEAVDITGDFSISQETKRGHLMLHASQPVTATTQRSQSVTGSIGKDGSFTLNIQASFPYPPDQSATCSAFPGAQLAGTLVK